MINSTNAQLHDKQPEQLAYTIPQLLKAFPISRATLYREIAVGKLKPMKCGRRTLIARQDVESWLQNMRSSGRAETVELQLSEPVA